HTLNRIQFDNIRIIPLNTEKFTSFTLKSNNVSFNFIDSFQFMGMSLENLASYLPHDLKICTSEYFGERRFGLMCRKGAFCYSDVDCYKKYSDQQLPAIDAFYNDLTGEKLSKTQYDHAQRVW